MSASLNWIAWCSCDRLAERLPLLRVLPRDVVRRLRDPEGLGGNPDPAAVERRHRDREALALLVQEPVSVHVRIDPQLGGRRRVQSELLLLARHLHVLAVEDERRDAARALRLGVGAGEEDQRARLRAGRDELLRTREAPAVPVCDRCRAQRPRVGARSRLGQRERADLLAARQRRHEPLPLLLGAEGEDRQRAGTRVHGHRDADTRIGA
jgi:hypothetical protein